MSKAHVFKETTVILTAAFPVLLDGLKQVSDAIPMPVGSVVKGVVQTTIFLMNKAEEYKNSREDIYLLAARSAQVVTTIVNECRRGRWAPEGGSLDSGVKRNLEEVKAILEEISDWVQRQTVTTGLTGKILRRLDSDITIKEVSRLSRLLDVAIDLFGFKMQISMQRTLSDIQETVESTRESMTDMKRSIESMEMIQFIEKKLPPRVETLFPTDPRCHTGTREGILDNIKEWLGASQSASAVMRPSIYWLTGVAGSGKSTVSRTVIEIAKERKLSCSWFYFSRDFPDRRQSDQLMTTIALDLISWQDVTLIQNIYDAIHVDGINGSSPLPRQMDGFLRRPLQAGGHPVVLVWDALDECTETESRQALLTILDSLPHLPSSTKVFLTSRPDGDFKSVQERLGSKVEHHDLTYNPEDERDSTSHDIDTYIRSRFGLMPRDGTDWPGDETFARLNELVGGLFMIAEFVCSFVNHPRRKIRLQNLLKDPNYGKGGPSTKKLYHRYRTGLDHLFKEDTSFEIEQAKDVMAAILVVQYPLSGTALAALLRLDEATDITLGRISSFLLLEPRKLAEVKGSPQAVRFIHKSISDFFVSKEAEKFHIDPVLASAHLAVPCLQILLDQVSEAFELCRSTRRPSRSGEHDLQNAQTSQVSEVLVYACRFWAYHLKDMMVLDKTTECLLEDFFSSHLLEWLHLMGHFDALDAAVSCLRCIEDWRPAATHSDIMELASDGIRFIRAFNYPLRTCMDMDSPSLHFTPKETLLYHTYSANIVTRPCIMGGIPDYWSPCLSILDGHMRMVESVVFSPDGKHIISGSADRTVCIWEVSTGQQLGCSLEGHTDQVTSVAFSPDGKHIISGSYDKTVRIWDALTKQELQLPLEGHTGPVTSVAFSPDGHCVVSGSHDRTVCIWDASTGQQLGSPLEGHKGPVASVAFSPDGKHIISGSYDKTVHIWDALTKQELGLPLEGHTGPVTSVAFSPDGKHIVSGSYDKTVCLWDVLNGQQLGLPLEGHTDWVMSVMFSPAGRHIISGSYDRTVYVWDAQTGQQLGLLLEGHTGPVTSIAFSPDGKCIVSGSYDRTVCVWDALTRPQLRSSLEGHKGPVTSIAFSPNRKFIISGSDDRTMCVWDVKTGQQLGSPLVGHTGPVTSVYFSFNGKYIISHSHDDTMGVWDASTGEHLESLDLLEDSLRWTIQSYLRSRCSRRIAPRLHEKTEQHAWTRLPLRFNRMAHAEFTELEGCTLLPDGWLKTLNGRQILWLPPDHCGFTMEWSDTSRYLVIGGKKGPLTIIKFY